MATPTRRSLPQWLTAIGTLVTAAAIVALARLGVELTDGDTRHDLAGWIEALATLTAVAAIAIGWQQLTESRTATRDQRKQAMQAALDQARPYVLVSLQVNRNSMSDYDLIIENAGAGPAYDITTTFDPPLERAKEPESDGCEVCEARTVAEARIFARPIPMLPPRYELRFWFDSAIERHKRPALPQQYEAVVSYSDGHGHHWTENLTLDLSVYNDLHHLPDYGMHHAAEALRGIEKTITQSVASQREP